MPVASGLARLYCDRLLTRVLSGTLNWPAVRRARLRDDAARVPFFIGTERAGSVARQHLDGLAAWPECLHTGAARVVLTSDQPTADLVAINGALHRLGLVPGWRNEIYAVTGLDSGLALAQTERAAARFWGFLTQGAHATGFVADAAGRPTHLWIAQRSPHKATDPGLLDNLVAGGVPDGQTPWQTLVREGFEEAGLLPELMATATPGRVIRLHRDVAEGLQLEEIHSFDLQLPARVQPHNHDGEVARFDCLPIQQALALACSESMTVDASLVTLDFALRHGLCAAPDGAAQLLRIA